MDTQNSQTENVPTPTPVSCRKHVKDEKASFFDNLKEGVSEFVHSSWDEHKACMKDSMNNVQDSMNKMLENFKTVEEKKVEAKEVESLPGAVESPAV